jgi:hypothetical protein
LGEEHRQIPIPVGFGLRLVYGVTRLLFPFGKELNGLFPPPPGFTFGDEMRAHGGTVILANPPGMVPNVSKKENG